MLLYRDPTAVYHIESCNNFSGASLPHHPQLLLARDPGPARPQGRLLPHLLLRGGESRPGWRLLMQCWSLCITNTGLRIFYIHFVLDCKVCGVRHSVHCQHVALRDHPQAPALPRPGGLHLGSHPRHVQGRQAQNVSEHIKVCMEVPV